MVEDPLRLPNWRLSICSPTSSIIQETTKSSKTLDKIGVPEIGRVSLSHRGCFTFGLGMMLEHFHRMGTSPVESDVLKITKTSRKSAIEEAVLEGRTVFCFNFFLQKIFARLTSLFLPLFAFETV